MASPPFSISTATPGDSDIVSQFPLNERGVRDIIQSWLLANHDTNGNHPQIIMPWQSATPATPSTSFITVFADNITGRLKIVYPDGTIGFVGSPPGFVGFTASAIPPVGWLLADGSAVSRTVFADLFTLFSTTYGAGNGSTTFNIPDLRGRVAAGEDSGSGRMSAAGFGSTAIQGVSGGLETQTLSLLQIPTGITSLNLTVPISVNLQGFTPFVPTNDISSVPTISTGSIKAPFSTSGSAWSSTNTSNPTNNTISVTSNNTSGQPHPNVQPTLILKAIIKT